MAKLLFVKCLTPDQPTVDELSQSKVRSHAAKVTLLRRRSTGGTITSLRDGNSDPFGSLAVVMTPRIIYAINFRRDYYIPACPFSREPAWATCRGQHKDDNIAIHKELSELRKPGSANAFVLHLVSIQARVESNDRGWKRDMLRLKIESVNAVQKVIMYGKSQDAANAIHWLFADAVMSGNLREALTHGLALKRLFGLKRTEEAPVDRLDLVHILWLDSHLSMMFMRHPIFDPEWANNKLYGSSNISRDCCTESRDFDPSIPKCLRHIFAQFRDALSIWRSSSLPTVQHTSGEVVGWIVAQSHLRKSRLVTTYLDNSNSIVGCIALAALCVEMTEGCDPTFGRRRLMPSMQTVMRHFYTNMQKQTRTGNAELWCLFIGAYIEQREAPNETDLWFNVAFALVARRMGLSSWSDVRNIVQGFLYNDSFKPAGSIWVEQVLTAKFDHSKEQQIIDIPAWVQPSSTGW